MGTKEKPDLFDRWDDADDDEPRFALLARDPVAPYLVEIWGMLRSGNWGGVKLITEQAAEAIRSTDIVTDFPQITASMQVATEMHKWRMINRPVVRKSPYRG